MAGRRPFDPRRIRGAGPPQGAAAPGAAPPGGGPPLLSVRQVNELVQGALARHVPSTVHVVGQIGDLSQPASGHIYLTLKDEDSELRCVVWRSSAARIKFRLTAGLEVVASGGLEVYVPRGSYQLIIQRVEPRGVGALELALRQLKEKLQREGLFDPRRKRPLPRYPQRIAVITSPSGAALRDILQTLHRRAPMLDVLVYPVRVQGEGAAAEIAAALAAVNRHAATWGGIDVIIAGRGGGSLEDLWAFNVETVARAIAASEIPVISAVGHEVDFTISDLVADLRAATPTAAAELVSPSRSELGALLAHYAARFGRLLTQRVHVARARVALLLARPVLMQPTARIERARQRVDEALQRLALVLDRRLRTQRTRLTKAELTLVRLRAGAHFARARQQLEARLHSAWRALHAVSRRSERRLATTTAHLERVQPGAALPLERQRLAFAARAAHAALVRRLREERRRLSATTQTLTACDPRHVLKRGYSITRDARTRRVLRSAGEIRDGQRIVTELADGTFKATAEDPRQPGLFEE